MSKVQKILSYKELFESEHIYEFESKLGVRKGFLANIYDEDDWTFIIKLHAFIEAACTHLLLYHFKEPNLEKYFSRMNLNGFPISKLNVLSSLGLIGKHNRNFIIRLSEIRNSLVHGVRNSEFTLKDFVENISNEDLKILARSLSPAESFVQYIQSKNLKIFKFEGNIVEQSKDKNIMRRLKETPKEHIWLGAYDVITSILDSYGYSEYQQWTKASKLFEEEDDR